tara:strand:- start:271 stop:492 length:222 start_codon:yes stop_codon:yes gene_type:complete
MGLVIRSKEWVARKGGGTLSTKGIALLLVRRELSDGSWGKKGRLCLNCDNCDNCAENRRKDFIFAAAIFKEDK